MCVSSNGPDVSNKAHEDYVQLPETIYLRVKPPIWGKELIPSIETVVRLPLVVRIKADIGGTGGWTVRDNWFVDYDEYYDIAPNSHEY